MTKITREQFEQILLTEPPLEEIVEFHKKVHRNPDMSLASFLIDKFADFVMAAEALCRHACKTGDMAQVEAVRENFAEFGPADTWAAVLGAEFSVNRPACDLVDAVLRIAEAGAPFEGDEELIEKKAQLTQERAEAIRKALEGDNGLPELPDDLMNGLREILEREFDEENPE